MIPATIIAPRQLQPGEDQVSPTSFGRHMLAEGDSWNSFGSAMGYGIPNFLEFPDRVLITNIASPGDTMASMVDLRGRELSRLLDSWEFDAILLSAGGNDLIAELPNIIRPGQQDPHSSIRWVSWHRLAVRLETGFAAISRAVAASRANKRTPIFVHTYDTPTPRPAAALDLGGLRVGPWLQPALANVPPECWVPVTDMLFDKLRSLILGLGLFNVVPVDTVGCCKRAELGAAGESGDWLNEIHLNRAGCRKVAGHLQGAISAHRRT